MPVKLILDINLSFRLALRLRDVFPGSTHASAFPAGRPGAGDNPLADLAKQRGYVVLTKDKDFKRIAGADPLVRVVHLLAADDGTQPRTAECEARVRANQDQIKALRAEPGHNYLPLGQRP